LRQVYEKAVYGPIRRTDNRKQALDFLKSWKDRPMPWPELERQLQKNAGFLDDVADAFRYLKSCDRDSATAQARKARQRIAEAAIVQGPKASLTWREAQQKFWPEYAGEGKNFRRILDECGYAWKRGKGGRPRGPARTAGKSYLGKGGGKKLEAHFFGPAKKLGYEKEALRVFFD